MGGGGVELYRRYRYRAKWLVQCVVLFTYLSGTSVMCQQGANLQFFTVFSRFGPMHQKFIP